MKKSPSPNADSAATRTFEQRLQRLEEIVALLDSGEAPLEELLVLYEEGIALSKECSAFLQSAEQKITMLSKAESV